MITTDFYSNPKRTETAPVPGTKRLTFDARQTITHLYLKYSGTGNTITIGGGVVSLVIDTTSNTLSGGTFVYKDSERLLIKLDTSVEINTTERIDATQGSNITISEFYAFAQILSFEDGAFSEIKFTPQQRTRGMHKMMNGGYRPYQGLGVMKRKMAFGSNHIPYTYAAHRAPETGVPPLMSLSDFPGDDPIFANADINRINNTVFKEHLTFMFADHLTNFPDRIFPACFEGESLDEPFSDLWKGAGYDVSFSVLEL